MAWPVGLPLTIEAFTVEPLDLEPYRVAFRGQPHAAGIYAERFQAHHYLDRPLPVAANAWVVFDDDHELAAFGSSMAYGQRNAVHECRLVVHPDHRGIGLGRALSTWVAEYHLDLGHAFYSMTQNSAVGAARDRSDLWRATRWNGRQRKSWHKHSGGHVTDTTVYCHRYVGTGAELATPTGVEPLALPLGTLLAGARTRPRLAAPKLASAGLDLSALLESVADWSPSVRWDDPAWQRHERDLDRQEERGARALVQELVADAEARAPTATPVVTPFTDAYSAMEFATAVQSMTALATRRLLIFGNPPPRCRWCGQSCPVVDDFATFVDTPAFGRCCVDCVASFEELMADGEYLSDKYGRDFRRSMARPADETY